MAGAPNEWAETEPVARDPGTGDDPSLVRRGASRVWSSMVAHPILAILLAISVAGAGAIMVTYTTDSSVTTATTEPPVQYNTGGDTGSTTDYVSSFSISTNKTYLTATVNGVPEANLTIDSFFKLQNVDDASQSVTLSTAQIANANVNDYSIIVVDGSDNQVGHLDLQAASPSTTFSIPASTTYDAKLHLELASGTADKDLGGGLSSSISLSVS